MEKIPAMLECSYCLRSRSHGGECRSDGDRRNGCLAFKLDPRGCIRSGNFKIPFKLYGEIPPLKTWCKGWLINEVSTEIKITNIYALKWDTKKGYLNIYCEVYYFINEYHEDYVEPKEKPDLIIVK